MSVVDLISDDGSDSLGEEIETMGEEGYRVTVGGPPVPMPRPRFYRTIVVNKADKKIAAFANSAKLYLASKGTTHFPVMGDVPVVLEVWFCLRLPNSAFVNGDRFRLKAEFRDPGVSHYRQYKPDADNLVKFVMDGLKGVAYPDDKCVVGLTCYKCMDTTPPYNGKTKCVFKAARASNMKPIPTWD